MGLHETIVARIKAHTDHATVSMRRRDWTVTVDALRREINRAQKLHASADNGLLREGYSSKIESLSRALRAIKAGIAINIGDV